jgi:prepilin-type N-terminal cleavage/methylation domain-containing protein
VKTPLFRQGVREIGFTLIELLVSMAILSIMLLTMATMMGFVSTIWLNGIGSMDNFTKARVVLNLVDRDIQMMVLRRDIAAFVDPSGASLDSYGNSICAFYTNVQGNPGTDTRSISLVQYLLNNPGSQPTLQRLNYGMNFLAASGVTPAIGQTSKLAAPANSTLQTETVFTGIVRFQIQFVDGTGTILTPPYTPTGTTKAAGPFSFNFLAPADPSNPRSVVVSMLVLSNPAYKLATQGGGTIMTKLLSTFPNTLTGSNQTFSQYWNSILNPSIGTIDPTLPPVVRGGIQVFERRVPLPINIPSA